MMVWGRPSAARPSPFLDLLWHAQTMSFAFMRRRVSAGMLDHYGSKRSDLSPSDVVRAS